MIKKPCLTCGYRLDCDCRLAYNPIDGGIIPVSIARTSVPSAAIREGFEWCGLQGANWIPSQEIDDIADSLCRYDMAAAVEELSTFATDGSAGLLEVEIAEHIDEARRLAAKISPEADYQPGLQVDVKKKPGRPSGKKI